jgi:hypothetical protein
MSDAFTQEVPVPGEVEMGKYAPLAASGLVRFRPRRGDRGVRWPRFEMEADPSPLETLLSMRDADSTRAFI